MKKLLLFCLCPMLLFTSMSFAACKEESSTEEGKLSGEVTLNDFEDYGRDFELIRVLNNFGVISVNEDEKYVKTGKKSAKINPMGGYLSNSQPLFYYPLISKKYDFDYGNLTYVRQVSAELYNAEDKDVNMSFGIVMEVLNTDMVNKTNPVKYVLKPGWNKVEYSVDVNVINILYNVEEAQGVYFGFDRIGSRNVEDAADIYLDNIKMVFSEQPAKVENVLTLSENEICSFDKLYQKSIVYADIEDPALEPIFSVVKASDYGIEATSGKSFLKLVVKKGDAWTRIVIPEAIMKASDLSKYKEDVEGAYFCFDLYSNSDRSLAFYPEFFDDGYGSCANMWETVAVPHEWTTYKIPLSALKNSMVAKPGFFRLAWSNSGGEDNMEIFIDSIRIEKY